MSRVQLSLGGLGVSLEPYMLPVYPHCGRCIGDGYFSGTCKISLPTCSFGPRVC